MDQPYLGPQEVGTLPGRLQALWTSLDPGVQYQWLLDATNEVNQTIGQVGYAAYNILPGLAAQTVTYTEWIDRARDGIALPNKPITSVLSIYVNQQYAPGYYLPITLTGDSQSVFLVGGQNVRYVMNFLLPTTVPYRGPMAFQEDDRVTITYTCGFTTIPVAVKNATRNLLSVKLFAEADNPGGSSSIGERGAHVDFGGKGNFMMQEAMDLLEPYTLITGL